MSLLVSLISINKILLTFIFVINFVLCWKFTRIVRCLLVSLLDGSGEEGFDGEDVSSPLEVEWIGLGSSLVSWGLEDSWVDAVSTPERVLAPACPFSSFLIISPHIFYSFLSEPLLFPIEHLLTRVCTSQQCSSERKGNSSLDGGSSRLGGKEVRLAKGWKNQRTSSGYLMFP